LLTPPAALSLKDRTDDEGVLQRLPLMEYRVDDRKERRMPTKEALTPAKKTTEPVKVIHEYVNMKVPLFCSKLRMSAVVRQIASPMIVNARYPLTNRCLAVVQIKRIDPIHRDRTDSKNNVAMPTVMDMDCMTWSGS